jgi:hypothetical protein
MLLGSRVVALEANDSMPKNMVFAWVGNVLIAVHGTDAPSEEEWRPYCASLKASRDLARVRTLAVTHSGAPTAAQRREMNDLLGGRPGLGAVLSTSAMVRGVVTAFSWFNPQIKAFSPAEQNEAFKHLKLTPPEITEVTRTISRLEAELRSGPKV